MKSERCPAAPGSMAGQDVSAPVPLSGWPSLDGSKNHIPRLALSMIGFAALAAPDLFPARFLGLRPPCFLSGRAAINPHPKKPSRLRQPGHTGQAAPEGIS